VCGKGVKQGLVCDFKQIDNSVAAIDRIEPAASTRDVVTGRRSPHGMRASGAGYEVGRSTIERMFL
jgi:hypothetical protein